MAILNVIKYPNKILKQHSKKVEIIDPQICELVDDMMETMFNTEGVGLAAIQVGINKSIFVYNDSKERDKKCNKVLINPTILEMKGEFISENEGCLSVPDFRSNVKRATHIIVEAQNLEGKVVKFNAEGLESVIIQHEVDHLNGILFINRISALKRNIYNRKIKKELKSK